MAALLSVSVIASGAALTACGGDDGEGGGNTKPIDEQTWTAASDELDYTNFSFRSNIGIEALIGENAVYCKYQMGDEYLSEYYSVINEDGRTITYRKMYQKNDDDDRPNHITIDNAKYFIDFSTTFEQAVASAKALVAFEVSYKDYYNSFTYNENTQEYVNSGVIEVLDIYYEDWGTDGFIDDVFTYHFVDNVVKISNDKIISYSCKMNWHSGVCHCVNQPDHNDEGTECDITLEYYDIGSTVVTVPPEVIAEATANSPLD